MHDVLIPPLTLGVIGGGQLGRMFAISAKQMGYKVAVLEKSKDCPSYRFADRFICGDYTDTEALQELARVSDVVTTEFENVPGSSLCFLEQRVPVYPSTHAVTVAQHRNLEKNFFNEIGLETTNYAFIQSKEHCLNVDPLLFPAILKTNTHGYDGKSQIHVKSKDQLCLAWEELGAKECILEQLVNLTKEISVIVARSKNECVLYPLIENRHLNGILDISIIPASVSEDIAEHACDAARLIADKLNYIGILAIEFFVTDENVLLVNEMAPRPHNSGHATIEACHTSQFEQQVRAICNLKLGNTDLVTPCVMLNLLGDIWNDQVDKRFSAILGHYPNLKLHLYEKNTPKIGRKMGHITLIGRDTERLASEIIEIKRHLSFK